MSVPIPTPPALDFADLDDEAGYARWREWKLRHQPVTLDEILVEITDPTRLTQAEEQALWTRIRCCNMAVYACRRAETDGKDAVRSLAARFGLQRLDHNWLADDDGITALEVKPDRGPGDYIPYTDRPIRWHTDGYYNGGHRPVRALLLHAVRPAARGGENRLADPEMAYLFLRDADPDFIQALMQPDVLTVPARMSSGRVARAEVTGPVFAVAPDGSLTMRYTQRRHNVRWKNDPLVARAQHFLAGMLESDLPFIFRGRLEAGMGLISNNVLHDRSGFEDDADRPRLLYRARYFDRLQAPRPAGAVATTSTRPRDARA